MAAEYFYWTESDGIRGPLPLAGLANLADDEIARTLVCAEGQNAWQPLAEVLPGHRPTVGPGTRLPAGPEPVGQVEALPGENGWEKPVPPGVEGPLGIPLRVLVLGSIVCALSGIGWISVLGRIAVFSAPLFFMAVVMGIAALVQQRSVGTVALCCAALVAPLAGWLCIPRPTGGKSTAPSVVAARPLSPDVEKKAAPEPAEERAPQVTPGPRVAKDDSGQKMEDMRRQLADVVQESAAVDRRAVLEARSSGDEPTPAPAPRRLPEKTWDHPHVYIQICDETQRAVAGLIKKQLQTDGDVVADIDNVRDHPSVPDTASEVRYIVPGDTGEAEQIAGVVRQFTSGNPVATAPPVPETPYVSHSRQYEIWLAKSFQPPLLVSRLDPAVINQWNAAQIQMAIDEIYARRGANFPRKKDQEWADRQSWYHAVPGLTHDAAEQSFTVEERADVELLAARRAALAKGENPEPVATPNLPPAVAESAAPTPALSLPELSPERVVTEVWNTNPQITVENFRARYADKPIRYTGTVVRKNPKEELLVFRGGGFMTSAYDVQATVKEDQKIGFRDVAVGDRVSLVATMDRIVPPAFGVGSSSIRLSEAQIYKKAR